MQDYYDKRYESIRSKIAELETEIGGVPADKQTDYGVKSQSDERSSETSYLSSEGHEGDQSDKNSDSQAQQTVTVYRKEGEVRKNQEIIKSLREQEASLPNPNLLTTWFKLDTNAVPPVYRLRNIRFVHL